MRILVLTSRVPYPLDKGDKLRIYHQVKHLAKNHDVLLCSIGSSNEEHVNHLKEICDVKTFKINRLKQLFSLIVGLFSDKPFQVKYFYQKIINKQVKEAISSFKPDHIYCQLIRCSEYVKKYHDIPKTLDYMDALSKGMERRIAYSNLLLKPLVKSEYKRLLRYENLMFEYFENKIIISEQDRDFIFHKNRKDIHVVSNGVDINYFTPKSIEKKFDLVFVGNLNYPPNIKACQYIVNNILPKLSSKTTVLLSGATPSQYVLNLASDEVTVRSWVDDIRESYSEGRIFVAPMLTGTGLQNKLLEAMAMKLPCITTPLVNNALKAEPGKDILIAQNEVEFLEKINLLLTDTKYSDNIALNGQKFIYQNYSWSAFNAKLEKIITA